MEQEEIDDITTMVHRIENLIFFIEKKGMEVMRNDEYRYGILGGNGPAAASMDLANGISSLQKLIREWGDAKFEYQNEKEANKDVNDLMEEIGLDDPNWLEKEDRKKLKRYIQKLLDGEQE